MKTLDFKSLSWNFLTIAAVSHTSLPYPPYSTLSPPTKRKKKVFESDVCTNHTGVKTTLETGEASVAFVCLQK